jgi:N-methylhydantoinase A
MSPARQAPRLRIGIDTGGTFTDVVCVDSGSGAMRVTKVVSTPANPAIGLVRGVREILEVAGAAANDVAGLAHGTTVATNALLQGSISGLGLVVTAGFRHLLEIARQSVPAGYGNSYFWVKPERIVPLHFVREVGGRLNFRGEELRPLDEASARDAARFFRSHGIHTVGICLLHSYANPAHERRVAEIFAEDYPECTLSLSCAVLPEYREYARGHDLGRCVRQAAYGTLSQPCARGARCFLAAQAVPRHAVERLARGCDGRGRVGVDGGRGG